MGFATAFAALWVILPPAAFTARAMIATDCVPESPPFDTAHIVTEIEKDCADTGCNIFCTELCIDLMWCSHSLEFLTDIQDLTQCASDCAFFAFRAISTNDHNFLHGLACLRNALRDSETCCNAAGTMECLVGPISAPGPGSADPQDTVVDHLFVDIDELGCDAVYCRSDCGVVLKDPQAMLPKVIDIRDTLHPGAACFMGIQEADPTDFDIQLDADFVSAATGRATSNEYFKITDGGFCDSPSGEDANVIIDFARLIVDLILDLITCSSESEDGCKGRLVKSSCTVEGVEHNSKSVCLALKNDKGKDGYNKCYCSKPGGMCAVIATAHSLVDMGIVDESWDCILTEEDGKIKWHEDFLKLLENISGDEDGSRGKYKNEVRRMHTAEWNDCWTVEFDTTMGWNDADGDSAEEWCQTLRKRLEHSPAEGKIAEDCYFRVYDKSGDIGGHGLKALSATWGEYTKPDGSKAQCCVVTNVETGRQDKPPGSFECTRKDPGTGDYVYCEDDDVFIPSYWKDRQRENWDGMEYGCHRVKLKEDEVWDFLMDQKYEGPGKTKECGPGSAFDNWKPSPEPSESPSMAPSPAPSPSGPSAHPSSSHSPVDPTTTTTSTEATTTSTATSTGTTTTTATATATERTTTGTTTEATTTSTSTSTGTTTTTATESTTTGTTTGTTTLSTTIDTQSPSSHPTAAPSPFPTSPPTVPPTRSPTTLPTPLPTPQPTHTPVSPTSAPVVPTTTSATTTTTTAAETTIITTTSATTEAMAHPSSHPTGSPSFPPTAAPSHTPTASPTWSPSFPPTASPSHSPTASQTPPAFPPTGEPSHTPTASPTWSPSFPPTASPSHTPTASPTWSPSFPPSFPPSASPSASFRQRRLVASSIACPTLSPTNSGGNTPTPAPAPAPAPQDCEANPITYPEFKNPNVPKLNESEPFCLEFSEVGNTLGFQPCPGHYGNIAVNVFGRLSPDNPINPRQDDFYLHLSDLPHSSLACGTGPEYTGDWTQVASSRCFHLCFDVNLFHDGCTPSNTNCKDNGEGGNFLPVQPLIILQGGPPHHYRAAFRASQYMTDCDGDHPGWRRVCAPLGPLEPDGSLPGGKDGQWFMMASIDVLSGIPSIPGQPAPNSAWPALLADVAAIQLPVDFTPSPTERVGYDHICLEKDCLVLCRPEPLCFWKNEWKCEDAQDAIWYSNFMQLVEGTETFDSKTFRICKVFDHCCPDLCDMAVQEYVALLLNLASNRVSSDCGVTEAGGCPISVGEAATIVDGLLSRSARNHYDCSLALQYLTGINLDEILTSDKKSCPWGQRK